MNHEDAVTLDAYIATLRAGDLAKLAAAEKRARSTQETLKVMIDALDDAIRVAAVATRVRDSYCANLTSTQARCTELLEEVRTLRVQLDNAERRTAARAGDLHDDSDPPASASAPYCGAV